MIKKLFVAAIAVIVSVNAYYVQESNVISDITLANIEALAGNEDINGGELPGIEVVCGAAGGSCWIQSGLCIKGEYMEYHCARTDNPNLSCTPC